VRPSKYRVPNADIFNPGVRQTDIDGIYYMDNPQSAMPLADDIASPTLEIMLWDPFQEFLDEQYLAWDMNSEEPEFAYLDGEAGDEQVFESEPDPQLQLPIDQSFDLSLNPLPRGPLFEEYGEDSLLPPASWLES
jgi:hypothetical protein